jgi:hypothetical protein
MTSIQQTEPKVKEEFSQVLREEQKDLEGETYDFDKSLSVSIHIHNPSKAVLKVWNQGKEGEYFSLRFSNSNDGISAIIFFKRDELEALETFLINGVSLSHQVKSGMNAEAILQVK